MASMPDDSRMAERDARIARLAWGGSSAGRASRSQCEGRGFDPLPLHQFPPVFPPFFPCGAVALESRCPPIVPLAEPPQPHETAQGARSAAPSRSCASHRAASAPLQMDADHLVAKFERSGIPLLTTGT